MVRASGRDPARKHCGVGMATGNPKMLAAVGIGLDHGLSRDLLMLKARRFLIDCDHDGSDNVRLATPNPEKQCFTAQPCTAA
jgi:hypothetical protein